MDTAAPYPAITRQATRLIRATHTEAVATQFSDKLVLTVSQGGNLGLWIQVSLLNDSPVATDPFANLYNHHRPRQQQEQQQQPAAPIAGDGDADEGINGDSDGLIPPARFAPQTLLGAPNTPRETVGHLLASQIAAKITRKNPREERMLMLGLGLARADADREVMVGILQLVEEVI